MGLIKNPKAALIPRDLPIRQNITMLAKAPINSRAFDHQVAGDSIGNNGGHARKPSLASDRTDADSPAAPLLTDVLMDGFEELAAHGDAK